MHFPKSHDFGATLSLIPRLNDGHFASSKDFAKAKYAEVYQRFASFKDLAKAKYEKPRNQHQTK